jgi:hypothetical protein
MQPLICQRCGATLTIPSDLAAVTAHCPFCGDQTPLPDSMLAARHQERQLLVEAQIAATTQQQAAAMQDQRTRSISRLVLWIVGLSVVGPIILTAIIEGFVYFAMKSPAVQVPMAAKADLESVPALPRPPPPPPDDPKSTGEERMTALMKAADAAGCKTVILPPTRDQGDQTLDTKFVVNGTCVRALVTTGMPDNKLTLTMKTPFGETIKTPEASTEIDFIYCPKKAGPHPTSISPTTDGYYTVAALECPASVANKKK